MNGRSDRRAKFARLRRHLDICSHEERPRRIRTRSARYAAALAEQLGMLCRPKACSWCRQHHKKLQRHHWDYSQPLNITFLCDDCHSVADAMVYSGAIA